MTKSDTVRIMAILRTAYPNFYKNQSREDVEAAIRLWADLFADDDPNVVAAAVKAHITACDSDFPPVIGQIKRQIWRITHRSLTEGEAWSLVREAVRGRLAASALPETVLRAAGGEAGITAMQGMDADRMESVAASNYQRTYRALEEQTREYAALPPSVRDMLPERPDPLRITAAAAQQAEAYYDSLREWQARRLEGDGKGEEA